ncbi:phosphoribosylamine--glycine ligase [bacterium]|nr:phosphoribosylamine--glycine ligase [bacterium]NUP92305.1 phosphoribosylamine--glycine ligase [Candidatus Omnitrophota bacterium]
MKVLIVGNGGREHALAWKLAQSPKVGQIFIAPGNGGTCLAGENIAIQSEDLDGLSGFSRQQQIDLTVVGPEAPLVNGIVDHFDSRGLRIFGPSKKAAQLEGSKHFAKTFMKEKGIPTAHSESFGSFETAVGYIKKRGTPIVIKADGLAAGKGVTVAQDLTTATQALRDCFENRAFGDAGSTVVIEDFLEGEEVSILAICDGQDYLILPSSQDHKRLLDQDRGPNTGGMGAYSPAPVVTPSLLEQVEKFIIHPTLEGMTAQGSPYKGVLYVGLILTREGPKVLEFNCRMGDPETQCVLPLVEFDLFDLFYSAAQGNLLHKGICPPSKRAAACVVMASGGYPGSIEKGIAISGTEKVQDEDVVIFHAGTGRAENGQLVTTGGRVLGVTACAESLSSALDKAYQAVGDIAFEGAQYRKDIGYRAINRVSSGSIPEKPGALKAKS